MNKLLKDPNYLNTLVDNDKIIAEKDINLFTIKYPIQLDGIEKCRDWAIDMFNENYNESIIKLLESFPPTGDVPFWINGKRCPKPIILDLTNKEHFEFIKVTSDLLLRCYSENKYFPQEFNFDNTI